MKRGIFIEAHESLYKLFIAKGIPGNTQKKLTKLFAWFIEEVKQFQKFENKMRATYNIEVDQEVKDEKTGEMIIKKQTIINPEKLEEFTKKIEEYNSVELNIDLPQIKFDQLKNVTELSTYDYHLLNFLITE